MCPLLLAEGQPKDAANGPTAHILHSGNISATLIWSPAHKIHTFYWPK